jgi:hypothetical protein
MAEAPANAILRDVLATYGLESMMDWAMDALARGLSETEVLQELRQRPEFKVRFPAIEAREKLGMPAISPAEYVEYERRVAQIMRDAGMPPDFYDRPDDFTRLLVADKSAAEVQAIVQDGYLRVQTAPAEVRDVFADWFGAAGDSALAAFFLDPDRAHPTIMRIANEAIFGGTGRRFGVNVSEPTAQRAVEVGGAASPVAGFQQLQEMSGYFAETITEQADLTAEEEGVQAVFGLGGPGAGRVRARQAERAAQFGGTTQAGTPGEAQDYLRRPQ